ncbi:50S ribosomal protein L28 [Ureaplasma canigenitalium]|uniref:50S ribosomal protein L28 n=1 Tax=Ureaplasma canigenitalium TaxID=42092 RepID=UPI0004E1FB94|nr:50S ribosomal protein L28 [Ureaplasma canigenitalium]
MAKKDQITGKGPLSGNTRSHAMNHSKRRWNLNLQRATVKLDDGTTARVRVTAKTLKTLKKHNMLG